MSKSLMDENFLVSTIVEKAIGKNIHYYRSAFRKIIKNQNSHRFEKFAGFNFAAAIFTSVWFAYRRMWNYAIIILIIDVILDIIFFKILHIEILYFIFTIAISIYIGIYANYFYMFSLNEKLIKSSDDDDNFIANSGTSFIGTIGFLFILFIIGIFRYKIGV